MRDDVVSTPASQDPMPSREPTTAAPADAYLRPGRFIDSDHPAVRAFARQHADPAMPLKDAHVVSGKVKSALRQALPNVRGVLVHMEPFVES